MNRILKLLKSIKIPINIPIMKLKHFKLSEFDSPDILGSGKKMDKLFLQKLDEARELAGIPFKINSGYRSEAWNLKVGGRIGSSHTGKVGLAADISYTGSRERYVILKSLMKVGLNRIGIGKTFIHVDMDTKKDADVIWTYEY